MANRRPRPGDRALILPAPVKGSLPVEYVGTICLVHEECWEVNKEAEAVIRTGALFGQQVRCTVDLSKPFWHCTMHDNTMAHVHEDVLEPIDPDADEDVRETNRDKGKPVEA